jgi:hypothetical protein
MSECTILKDLMLSRYLCLFVLTAASVTPALSAPTKSKTPAKKTAAVVKPPPAPPKGKATFPKQKHRRPAGKIIKIFPSDKHLDPKELAAAPTVNQVAAKQASTAIVKPPKAVKKPKKATKPPTKAPR